MTTTARRCALAVAVCALLALAPAAAAEHVQCGDVLTVDTRLDGDLECVGAGLTVAADDVTLDLGGHTVAGSGPTGVAAGTVSNVSVRNGAVRGFDVDVSLQDVTGSTVRDIGEASIFVAGDLNLVKDNLAAAGIAIRGDGNVAVGNLVSSPTRDDDATWFSLSGADNLITHNEIVNVAPTTTDASAFGMLLRLSGGYVLHNFVAAAPGWPQEPGSSVVGIHLSGRNGLVRHNVATAHDDGFLVVASSLRLLDNFAFENRDDGIDVDVSGNRLSRNTADDNGDLGIEAVPATIDGRGNRARGNGNPAQCVGVVCR